MLQCTDAFDYACSWMVSNDIVTFLPAPTSPNDTLLRLNASPSAISQMFCSLHPHFNERYVRKQLEEGSWKVMKHSLCMCQQCLAFRSSVDNLRELMKALLAMELSEADCADLLLTNDQLREAADTAIEFILYRFPTHVISTMSALVTAAADGEPPQCDGCALHCCTWALSANAQGKAGPAADEGIFCSDCPREHSMSCSDCNLLFQVVDELERRLEKHRKRLEVRNILVDEPLQSECQKYISRGTQCGRCSPFLPAITPSV